MHGGESLKLSI